MPDNSGSQGVKNSSQEILDSITSDSTKFAGANIDAKISNAGLNPDVVREQSGIIGDNLNFMISQPSNVEATSSGGASISFVLSGALISCGATSGDTSGLRASNPFNWDTVSRVVTSIMFDVRETTPYSSNTEIGFAGTGAGNPSRVVLDLASGDYVVGGTTSSATLPSENQVGILTIDVDIENGETTFTQSGAVSESVTIQNTTGLARGVTCLHESTGTDQTIVIIYQTMKVLR